MSAESSNEVEVKLVVAGAAGSGRGELLRAFAERSGGVPVREGVVGSARVWRVETIWPEPLADGRLLRVRLFAGTGAGEYNAVEQLMLRGVDGVVVLLDVSLDRLQQGWDAMLRLHDNLRRAGLELTRIPLVVQYHRTDRHYGFDARRMDEWLGLSADQVVRFTSRSGEVDGEGAAIDSVVAQAASRMLAREAS